MKKTVSICIILLGLVLVVQAQNKDDQARPNVIFILADDMGWADVGQKDPRIETPNLNRLAAEGIRLTNFYASSSLCSPTRAALLSGRYPQSVGVPDLASPEARGKVPILALDHEAVTIPEALKPLGYQSMIAGKWHLGFFKENWPRTHGFDEYWGSLIGTPGHFQPKEVYHNETPIHADKYFTDWITDKGLDFIGKRQGQPFFLYLAYNAPHYPLEAPAPLVYKYRKRFPEDGLFAIYAAMIERLDYNIGRVLDTLDKLKLADRTLIMFCSDNGPSAEPNSYGLPGAKISRGPFKGHKFSMYEGGIRVPFIARWPGKIPKGSVRSETAVTMDVLPTILQAVGVKSLPAKLDGTSFLPLLENKLYTRKGTIHWENIYNMAVLKDQWKLVDQFWEDGPHLYHLKNDPYEQRDVAKENPDKVKELMAEHQQWVKTNYPHQIPHFNKRPRYRIPLNEHYDKSAQSD